jgi:hypothetical protein
MPNEQIIDGFRRYKLGHKAVKTRFSGKNYSMERNQKSLACFGMFWHFDGLLVFKFPGPILFDL